MKKLVPLLLSGVFLLGTTSCKNESADAGTSLQEAILSAVTVEVEDENATKQLITLPREKTLYLVGFQWGDPSSFNPFNGWPAWPIRTEFNLMYEQLTSYNSLTGETEELLGRLEETNNDYVSVILNNAAKWSDGTPLTAEDVLFTYNLNITNGEAPGSYIQGFLKSVEVDTLYTLSYNEDSTVVDTTNKEARIKFMVDKEDRNNPAVLEDFISTVPILPKHVFQPKLNANGGSISAINEDMMGHAQVVSGPYNLEGFSNEKIILKRRDDYWGNEALHGGRLPKPEYLVHPIYKNNEASSNAIKHGELDISANYMPRIGLKKKYGVGTWFSDYPFFKPGAAPMLIFNTTKKPMDDKHYRRAVAFAIDYAKVAALGFSGYSDTIRSGLVMPFSAEKKYYSQEEVDKYGATIYAPERAKEELALGGYTSHFEDTTVTKDGDTTFGNLMYMTDKEGNRLPTLEIMSPSGWTDFESVIKLAVKSMRKCGIDVREGFVDASQYWPSKNTGQFDIFMDTPASKLTATMPWARFETVMASSEWKPIEENMYVNIGRFNKPGSPEYIPEIDSLLAAIPLMSEEADLQEAYTLLNRYFMEEQPTIPLLYRPEEFYEFSTKHWKNFPTAVKNEKLGHGGPYLPPHMPVAASGTKLLWEIEPVATTEEH